MTSEVFVSHETEDDNRFTPQFNSTAIDASSFAVPKTPARDLKLSPILRDDSRTPFRRLMMCRTRGESPLTKPRISKIDSFDDFNIKSDSPSTSSSSSSGRSEKESLGCSTRSYNPFETGLLESITRHTISPTIFDKIATPKWNGSWSIEERAVLFPAHITEEEISQSKFSPDSAFEASVNAQLDIYWKHNMLVVPSPDGPQRQIIDDSPANFSAPRYPIVCSSTPSPSRRIGVARRRIVAMRNSSSQTSLSIPPTFDFDFKSILGEACCFDSELEVEDEFNVSVMNTSLPRKLFSDDIMQNEDYETENDLASPSLRHDLGVEEEIRHQNAPLFSLDFSPIKLEFD